jgi:hypothetical protein
MAPHVSTFSVFRAIFSCRDDGDGFVLAVLDVVTLEEPYLCWFQFGGLSSRLLLKTCARSNTKTIFYYRKWNGLLASCVSFLHSNLGIALLELFTLLAEQLSPNTWINQDRDKSKRTAGSIGLVRRRDLPHSYIPSIREQTSTMNPFLDFVVRKFQDARDI